MPFRLSTRPGTLPVPGDVYTLASDTARIEVWPTAGFNCLRWQVRTGDGWGDLLYAAPDWETNPVPTRSGHPILFPFPNRLKFGRFEFAGKTYQLPLTESTKTHAIHGFTPRTPWRAAGTTAEGDSASITGELQLSKDLPGAVWPADFVLRVTYTVAATRLSVWAEVTNPDDKPLPFGLGYHGYFRLPSAPDAPVDEFILEAATGSLWVAENSLATGAEVPTPADVDFRAQRPLGATALDHLYRRVSPSAPALIRHVREPGSLVIDATPAFRELLLFTPPHRRALAVEPYTCTSDAANLTARGIDAGWQVLAPGESWQAGVAYLWYPPDAADQIANPANPN